jgi:hypothetical protein
MNTEDKQLSTTKWAKYQRTYRSKNKETCLKCETKYRNTPEGKKKAAIRFQQWKEANKQKYLDYLKEYNKKNRIVLNEYQKQYNKERNITENKQKITKNKTLRLNKEKTKEQQKQYRKQYREKNKIKINEYHKNYIKHRYASDNLFKATAKLRAAVAEAFNRIKKNKPFNTETLLGCSFEDAKKRIENLWKEGMSWENHGLHGWHIDHIRPVSDFTEHELHLMNHISNLQPLWAKENLNKSNVWNK